MFIVLSHILMHIEMFITPRVFDIFKNCVINDVLRCMYLYFATFEVESCCNIAIRFEWCRIVLHVG